MNINELSDPCPMRAQGLLFSLLVPHLGFAPLARTREARGLQVGPGVRRRTLGSTRAAEMVLRGSCIGMAFDSLLPSGGKWLDTKGAAMVLIHVTNSTYWGGDHCGRPQ